LCANFENFLAASKGEIDAALQKQLLRKLVNVAEIEEKAREIIAARGAIAEEVSPSIADPLIEAAADEERAEPKDLWAKLLAAAMDPSRKNLVRLSFITTLKQMDPLDARVLEALYGIYPAGFGQGMNGRDQLSQQLSVTHDEVLVSFGNLESLNCVGFSLERPKISPIITPSGRLLIEALR
jgi:Abortive infection alpha